MRAGSAILHPEIVTALPQLSNSALRLAVALAKYQDREGRCHPAVRTLMQVAGIHDWRTFARARDELHRIGLIWTAQRGRKGSTQYSWRFMPVTTPDNKPENICNGSRHKEHETPVTTPDNKPENTCNRSRQNLKRKKTTKDNGASPLPSLFISHWNDMAKAAGLPTIREMTAGRRKAFRSRWGQPSWRDAWEEALGRIPTAPFLCGENARGWRASVDWFLRPDSVNGILEGKYDSNGHKPPPASCMEVVFR